MTVKIASDRYEGLSAPNHDDMLGVLSTGIAGGNQWNVKNISDSLCPIGFLRDNSTDFAIVRIQSPHWRKHSVALDSIHVHYILDSAPTVGQTAIFDTFWTWITPGTIVPALVSWNSVNTVLTFDGTEPAWFYDIFSVVNAPAAPPVEGYGLYLLVRIVRGNGTYNGEIGILDVDAHAQKDRMGSKNEFTD